MQNTIKIGRYDEFESQSYPGRFKVDWFYFSLELINKTILDEIGMTWDEIKTIFKDVRLGYILDDGKPPNTIDYTKCAFKDVFNYWYGKEETWNTFDFLPYSSSACVRSTDWQGGIGYS